MSVDNTDLEFLDFGPVDDCRTMQFPCRGPTFVITLYVGPKFYDMTNGAGPLLKRNAGIRQSFNTFSQIGSAYKFKVCCNFSCVKPNLHVLNKNQEAVV